MSFGLLFSSSLDARADVNSLLEKATQAMTEKFHFYKTCLQVEIKDVELVELESNEAQESNTGTTAVWFVREGN